MTALGLALLRALRRPGWTVRHIAAAGRGLLLGRELLAFTTTPLAGEVGQAAKLSHDAVMLAAALLAGAAGTRNEARSGGA